MFGLREFLKPNLFFDIYSLVTLQFLTLLTNYNIVIN